MTYHRRDVDVQTEEPVATVSTVMFGPCWCRAVPGADGSFDVFRYRSVTAPLARDVLVVSNRVPPTGVAIVQRTHASLSDPVVFETKACPTADWYWDASPPGWVGVDELIEVDRHIDACLTGQPERIFPALLTVCDLPAQGSRVGVLTGIV